MATIERITSTGDVEKDAKAINELHQESLASQMTHEEALEREQKAREAALEPPRNALVENPYSAGETIEVVVHEGDDKDVSESATDTSGGDESIVDRQKASVRKNFDGSVTRQAAASPQPAITANDLKE